MLYIKVVVLGAGVAGLQAIATAKRLGAVVSAPRLYGFMNLAANEIHHEEEYTFFGCCSAQFCRFMLPPRHIQGA